MLNYLWKHRQKLPLGSKTWFKEWAKRIWTSPSMARFYWRTVSLKRRGAAIGEGTLISGIHAAGNFGFLRVGNNSFIGRVSMHLHARIEIGSNVCINDGVSFICASHDIRDPHWKQFARPICIGDHAWIAIGAVILPGVSIGRGAVVGAFAVVSKDVPDFAVATGNPARIRENVRSRELTYSPIDFVAFRSAWMGQQPTK